jgi:hypothetical protein
MDIHEEVWVYPNNEIAMNLNYDFSKTLGKGNADMLIQIIGGSFASLVGEFSGEEEGAKDTKKAIDSLYQAFFSKKNGKYEAFDTIISVTEEMEKQLSVDTIVKELNEVDTNNVLTQAEKIVVATNAKYLAKKLSLRIKFDVVGKQIFYGLSLARVDYQKIDQTFKILNKIEEYKDFQFPIHLERNKLIRRSYSLIPSDKDNESGMGGGASGMNFGEFFYKTKYHFPSKVKKVQDKVGGKFEDDGQTFVKNFALTKIIMGQDSLANEFRW